MKSTLVINFVIGPASAELADQLEASFPANSFVVGKIDAPTVDDNGTPDGQEPVRTWIVESPTGLHHWARPNNDAAQAAIARLRNENVPFRFFCQGDIEENPAILDWEPGVAGPSVVRSADLDGYPTITEPEFARLRAEHGPMSGPQALEFVAALEVRLRDAADPTALTYPRNRVL